MDAIGVTVGSFPVAERAVPVVSNRAVNPEYMHLVVAAEPPATNARPGQFFHLLCPVSIAGAPFLRRPMSVYAADPERGQVEFLYKLTGAGTRGLGALKPGDRLDMVGPLGKGFTLEPGWRHIVVLGRGVGLAAAGKADAFFTCGSNRLMLLTQRLGRELRIPGQVALEQQMACGLGMCFCCVREFRAGSEVEHRRVCWDGPVFDLQEPLSW